jgi:hypothetical protein
VADTAWVAPLSQYLNLPATAVTGTSLTAIVPDILIPAGTVGVGKLYRATIYGELSTVASPGTAVFQVMWGGIGGTSLAASAAIALDVSATNESWRLEYLIQCTAANTLFVQGRFETPSLRSLIPVSPAAVSGLSFVSAQNLDFNVTFNTAGNSLTANCYLLEDCT